EPAGLVVEHLESCSAYFVDAIDTAGDAHRESCTKRDLNGLRPRQLIFIVVQRTPKRHLETDSLRLGLINLGLEAQFDVGEKILGFAGGGIDGCRRHLSLHLCKGRLCEWEQPRAVLFVGTTVLVARAAQERSIDRV